MLVALTAHFLLFASYSVNIDMAASLLFNSERGILYFLKRSLDKSVHVAAKSTFLEFTAEFISRSPNTITPYIVEIKVRELAKVECIQDRR